VTGRVADPSIFMAPMMHEFGWMRWTMLVSAPAMASAI